MAPSGLGDSIAIRIGNGAGRWVSDLIFGITLNAISINSIISERPDDNLERVIFGITLLPRRTARVIKAPGIQVSSNLTFQFTFVHILPYE